MSTQKAMRSNSCKHPALTEAEFQSLPPSIQKKYFSTLERLQILQHSSDIHLRRPPPKSHSPPRASAIQIRPTTSKSFASSIRRPKQQSSLHLEQFELQADTEFYLSLPDKIRRQQFSQEEQLKIRQHLEARATLSIPGSSQGSRRPSTSSGSKSTLRKDSKCPSLETIQRPVTASMTCFERRPSRVDRRRPSLPKDPTSHRPASSCFAPNSPYSSPTLCSPASPTFAHHQRQMSSRTATMVRPSMDSTISIDASAIYYQDPEARMKLRKYLASPQKFDEAIEFGFPSLPTRNSMSERDPAFRAVAYTKTGNEVQRLLREDHSLDKHYSVESSDDETVSFNDSPVTPASGEDIAPRVRPYGASIFNGLDKSDLPSLRFNFDGMSDIIEGTEPGPTNYDPLANREMTLRMTLTRPELRATSEELYGWEEQEQRDPLALERLHLSDDMTGRHGAFAIKPSASYRNRRAGVFKRIFGRVTSR